jgi:hypothetical protein
MQYTHRRLESRPAVSLEVGSRCWLYPPVIVPPVAVARGGARGVCPATIISYTVKNDDVTGARRDSVGCGNKKY